MKKAKKLLSTLLLISVIGSAVTFGIILFTDRDSLSSGYNIKKYFDITDASDIVIDTNTRLAFGKLDKDGRPYAEFEYKKTGITAIDPKYELTAKKVGNSVRIILNNKLPGLVTVGNTETKLTVYLPDVKFDTAVVRCGGLDEENGLLSARDLDLNVKDDDIELNNTYEVLKINTGGGNISIKNNTGLEQLSASTDDGDVELAIPAGISGLELDYYIYDGKLNSEFDLDTVLGEGRLKGTAYFGDRSVKVSAATGEGNIIIRKD